MTKRIAVLVGSSRKESLNLKKARALIELAPKSLQMEIINLTDLPMYNQELEDENKVPAEWLAFREKIKTFDGLLFVTPEHNRSVPALLKSAIDIGSRPYGQNIWAGKPGAIVSVSPATTGRFGANHHLRQSMVFLDVPLLQQPEAYIGQASNLFDANGTISNESTRNYMTKFIQAYAQWVETNAKS